MTGKIEYYSITSETTAEWTVKRSKFIAHASPTSATQSGDKYIATISRQFQEATHNCFAYKIGTGDAASFRFSDAGEPSGSAGRPILRAIEHRNLTNVVVVVSRYFGGIKLGTGGLSRAYHSAALTVLDKANIIEYYPRILFSLKFPYPFANAVHQVLHKYNGQVLKTRFEQGSVYLVQLKAADEADFRDELTNISKGKICIEQENSRD